MSVTEEQVQRAHRRFDQAYWDAKRDGARPDAYRAASHDEAVHEALEAILTEQDPDWQRSRPCVVFGAELIPLAPGDSAKWRAWFGGLSAEGETPEEAMDNFDRAWRGERIDPDEVRF